MMPLPNSVKRSDRTDPIIGYLLRETFIDVNSVNMDLYLGGPGGNSRDSLKCHKQTMTTKRTTATKSKDILISYTAS